jgi:hypothetical protein
LTPEVKNLASALEKQRSEEAVTPKVKNLASGMDRQGREENEQPAVGSAMKSVASASVSEDSEEDDLPALITTVENLAVMEDDQSAVRAEVKNLAKVVDKKNCDNTGQDSEDDDQMVTGLAENITALPFGRQDTEGADQLTVGPEVMSLVSTIDRKEGLRQVVTTKASVIYRQGHDKGDRPALKALARTIEQKDCVGVCQLKLKPEENSLKIAMEKQNIDEADPSENPATENSSSSALDKPKIEDTDQSEASLASNSESSVMEMQDSEYPVQPEIIPPLSDRGKDLKDKVYGVLASAVGREGTEDYDRNKPSLAIREQSSTEVNLCNQQQVSPPYKESLEAGARSLNMSADGKHSNSLEFTNIFQVEDLASSSSEDEDTGAAGGLRWVYSVNPAVHLEARINNNKGSWESVEATDSSLPILITDDIEGPSFKAIQTAINQGCSDLTSSISKTCTEDSIPSAANTLALDALDCAASSSLLSETNSTETHLISEQIQLTVPEQIQLIPRRPSLGTSY